MTTETKTQQWTPGLGSRSAGDWIWLEIERYHSGVKVRELRQVEHVDRKGRLYISAESLWGNWRYGFRPDTGQALEYKWYTMVDATPEEIAAELQQMAIRADQAKAKKAADNLKWRQEQHAPEMAEALRRLVEQFHAYENGWLGEGIWRTRIGLPDDLHDAERLLSKIGGPQ